MTARPMSGTVYRKGLDLKQEVAGDIANDYHSRLIDAMKQAGYASRVGRLTVRLPREFGFCYGVDRAVDYAYQTRKRFPDRRVFLAGEIIHNPNVNDRLREAGVRFLADLGDSIEHLDPADVVIIPAFGVTVEALQHLQRRGCTLVDTTCGSVLNVWKNVRKYARDGYTAVIHGKAHHEETRATASQTADVNAGHYLIVLDRPQAELLCGQIRGTADRDRFLATFADACSPGFDPDRDLERVGLANQTTMLMSESIEIGEMIRLAMIDRYGAAALAGHYRAFDTICSATQDRQDALVEMLDEHRLDLAVVIGGYNSSNTRNLARICAEHIPTYHIADPACLVSATELRHRPLSAPAGPGGADQGDEQVTARAWLPPRGPVAVAVTAGASTPDSIVGAVVEKLGAFVANG